MGKRGDGNMEPKFKIIFNNQNFKWFQYVILKDAP